MEIERINENTVKFYISYVDIEDRGFEREEIWYNRERSEQLFWQMMDEVNYEEDFNVDGPLWIQVQAMEKGLEIIVTKAQVSKNGEQLELPGENGKTIDLDVDDKIEDLLDDKYGSEEQEDTGEDEDDHLSLIMKFRNFEDVIQLSHYMPENIDEVENKLYHYEEHYYLYIGFDDEMMDDDLQEDVMSMMFEFSEDTQTTVHILEEYGNVIFEDNTFSQVRHHFPAQI